ncbi:MAG TPA: DUF4388 domain-containing protein, partial [Candidatus Acidoferrum sp.]|nr:DUF4388 domain-containing protein [Candidatus Acidoferrum sp.]
MALEGTFKDFHIADIVQLIGLQRKSGTLTLEGQEETLTLMFQDGAVVWAQSDRTPWEKRITQVLIARGVLTPLQLQEALDVQKGGKKNLSTVLEEQGYLKKNEWNSVLVREVEEAVYRPFGWTSGRYQFLPQDSVEKGETTIGPLGAENVLMEGIRRVDEWPMILERIPSMAIVFKVGSGDGRPILNQIDPCEVKMLALVDGRRAVRELVDCSGLGEFEGMRGLAALVGSGAITPTGPVPVVTPKSPVLRPVPLPRRAPRVSPRWIARLTWGVAAACFLVSMIVFRTEPLGLFPVSAAHVQSLDSVRILRAQADLAELGKAVEIFQARMGEYP